MEGLSTNSTVSYIPGTVSCPSCDNRPVVNPFEQKADRGCQLCAQSGMVNPKKVCSCGRPAIWVINQKDVCNTEGCIQDAFKEKKVPKVSEEDLQRIMEMNWAGML